MFYLNAFQRWRKTPGTTGRKNNWDKGTVPRNASKLQGRQKMCNRSQTHQYRDLCCVSHTYPAPLYYRHMLGMSGIHPLQCPPGNPPLQTAQTTTDSSQFAEGVCVRSQSSSANSPCEHPNWTRVQIWTNSKFCPWKQCDNKAISSWDARVGWVRKIRWKANANRAVTHSTHLSQDSPDKNTTGPERASNPCSSHKIRDTEILYF